MEKLKFSPFQDAERKPVPICSGPEVASPGLCLCLGQGRPPTAGGGDQIPMKTLMQKEKTLKMGVSLIAGDTLPVLPDFFEHRFPR